MTASAVLLLPVGIDPSMVGETESVLASHRMEYSVVPEVEEALRLAMISPPPLAIIHGGPLTPTMLGVLRRLQTLRVPALALVELLTDAQEAMLLSSGALDVVGLPTSQQRLRTRILAMDRYVARQVDRDSDEEEQHVVGDLMIHVGRREVRVGSTPIDVTKTEFELLLALVRHPRKVVTREELALQALDGRTVGAHTLESHLSRLRGKILSAHGPRLFEPVRGVGYRLGA